MAATINTKCRVYMLHLGRTNHNYTYTLSSNQLQEMKDIIDKELKFHDHIATTVTKVDRLLGIIICKSFMSLDMNTYPQLYKVLICLVI